MPAAHLFPPRLMPAAAAAAAAHYIGVSETRLRELGIPRRVLGAKRLYHITDLDAYAYALPMEGESGGEDWDEVFRAGASG